MEQGAAGWQLWGIEAPENSQPGTIKALVCLLWHSELPQAQLLAYVIKPLHSPVALPQILDTFEISAPE